MQTSPLFRILHFSDLHLGKKSYDLVERIRDHAAVLEQINRLVNGMEDWPDLCCVTGDVFDSPSVDSFSCDAFRRFVEKLPAFIPLLVLTGNHDRERLDLGTTRVGSLGGERLLPLGGPHEFFAPGKVPVRVLALDWMPAADIARELEAIQPGELDVLCLHQSVEGFLPAVGTPEVRLDQLRGKARLVLVGDVHVNRSARDRGGNDGGQRGLDRDVRLRRRPEQGRQADQLRRREPLRGGHSRSAAHDAGDRHLERARRSGV